MSLRDYLGLVQQNKYAYSVSLLIAFFLMSKLFVLISQKVILRLAKKTRTDIDDLLVRKTNKPISLILLLIGIRLALFPLWLNQGIVKVMEHLILSLIVIAITYIIVAVFDIFIDNWGKRVSERTNSAVDSQFIKLFHRFSRVFISIVGLLFVLPIWGIQIGPLLTSLGIAGIAIAFALQSSLANIFGGASILLDKSIKVGDKIKLDNETMGTVVDVGLRSTKIRTFDNELVTVPNGKLADSKILNFIQPDSSVRTVVEFGVEYGSDTSKVREVVLNTLNHLPNLLKEPEPKVLMAEMGESALRFRALFWVNQFDVKFDTKALAIENIYNALRKAGIGIPFPTRTVYMKNK